jgi:hypothetical protein
LAAAIVVVAACSLALFVATHRTAQEVSTEAGTAEFGRLRAQLLGDQAHPAPGPSRVIRTVIFDTRGGGRLVQVEAPVWLVRLWARNGKLHSLGELTFFDDTEFDPDPVDLSLAQLQRQRGLLADRHHASGGQFISWSE